MKHIHKVFGIIACTVLIGLFMTGCDNGSQLGSNTSNNTGNGNSSGGGNKPGVVSLTNSWGNTLLGVTLSRSGTVVNAYGNLANNRTARWTGLEPGNHKLEFSTGTTKRSSTFMVGSGEPVSITFSSNGNFLVSRGESAGTDSSERGSIRISNNSGYALYSVMFVLDGQVVKTDGSLAKGASKIYTDIPVGYVTVRVARSGGIRLMWWERSVSVSKGNTSTVTISSTGWE